MSIHKTYLTYTQCRIAAANQWTAGQLSARLGREISTASLLDAMRFHQIPYKSKHRINHSEGRAPVESTQAVNNPLRSVRPPRVYKIGGASRRGVVRR